MSKFVHYELNTSDPKAAKKFYRAVFNWKFQDMPMGSGSVYTMVSSADGPVGGIQQHPMPGTPSAWLAYAEVASVDKSVAKAKKLGGKSIVPKQVIPGMGEFAVLADPTGATFAIWKSLQSAPKPAKKKAAKKSAKKKAAKKSAKKSAKKKAAKKSAKKRPAKKRAAKKSAKKRPAKRKAAKKSAKKRTAKKKPARRKAAKKR